MNAVTLLAALALNAHCAPPEPMLWPLAIPVGSAASADGKTLALAGQDGNIRLFTFGKGIAMRSLNCANRSPSELALSPDGALLAAAGCGNSAAIFDVRAGRQLAALNISKTPERLLFSADGKTLAAVSGGETELFAAATGRRAGKFSTEGRPDLALARSASWAKYAAAKGKVALLDAQQRKWLEPFYGVRKVWYSPGGKLLVHGFGPEVRRVPGGEEVELEGLPGEHAQYVAFSGDGGRMAVLREYGNVQAWDLKTGKLTAAFNWRENNPMMEQREAMFKRPRGFYFVDGARALAIVTEAGPVELWSADTGKKVRALNPNTAAVSALAALPAARQLLSADWDGAVTLWDLRKGGVLRRWPSVTEGWPAQLAVSADGENFFYAEDSFTFGALRRLDGSGEAVHFSGRRQRLHREDKRNYAVLRDPFSPGNILLLDAAASRDKDMIAALKAAKKLEDASFSEYAMDMAPGGGLMAIGLKDGGVGLADLDTGAMRRLPGSGLHVWNVCFSTDGARLATGDVGGNVTIWDAATWKPVLKLAGFSSYGYNRSPLSPDGVYGVAPDRPEESMQQLHKGIAPDPAKTPRFTLMDTRTSKPLQIEEPGEPVLTFSPDSAALAARRANGGVKVWATATGKPLAELQPAPAQLRSLAFWSGNGSLFAGGADGVIRLYDLPTGKHLLSMTAFMDGEWLISVPGGRYKASKGAAKYLKAAGKDKSSAPAAYEAPADVEAALSVLP